MTDCVCHHNAGFGFFLEHADFCVIQHAICHHTNIGILLYYATNNTIQNSETSNNSWAGIEIRDVSNDNTVINCSTHHNREGIMILVSLDNILYHNNMYSNYENGYDDSFNSWDNAYPNGGNYWSDYHGVDDYSGEEQLVPGSDGIGDTPYQINGSGSIDRYPFMVSNGWMNQAPATPQQPQGPLHGCIGFTYTFYTYAVDPDDDALYYMWDWGDQTIELLGPNPSGIVFNASHRWNTSGSYSIRVKVQDSHGLESAWSEPLVVIIKTMINDHFYIHYKDTFFFNCSFS